MNILESDEWNLWMSPLLGRSHICDHDLNELAFLEIERRNLLYRVYVKDKRNKLLVPSKNTVSYSEIITAFMM